MASTSQPRDSQIAQLLHDVKELSRLDPLPRLIAQVNGLFSLPMGEKKSYPFGVNVIGYFNAEIGVSENPKSIIKALATVGIPYAIKSIITNHPYRDSDLPCQDDCPYRVNILCLDPSHIIGLPISLVADRINIMLYVWELEVPLPLSHLISNHVDEIWTISRFTASSLEGQIGCKLVTLKIPPSKMGCPGTKEQSRELFAIPQDTFVVLFMFDFFSCPERKNPYAVIEAFRTSLGEAKALLVIKAINGDHHRLDSLKNQAGPKIRILDHQYTRDETLNLINACDVYISLHRSEGSGLTMIEAMAMGKPVIATGYSGNLDFMDRDRSFLVGWTYRPVSGYYATLGLEAKWAEPDVNEAGAYLSQLYHSPELRDEYGRRARAYIERYWNHEQLGYTIKERLVELVRLQFTDSKP